jgi:hypothetical protein
VFQVFWRLVFAAIRKLFFFVVDVLPAHGANTDEAKAVVLLGDLFLLNKKLENEIENWTEEDSRRLLSQSLNWRARSFFSPMERFSYCIQELKRIHRETGNQPSDQVPSACEEPLAAWPIYANKSHT